MSAQCAAVVKVLASAVLIVLLRVPCVQAHSTGETGHSQDGCNSCHSGGVAPDVDVSGPAVVGVDGTATYQFEVHARGAQQRAAGFDVSASGGRLGVLPNQDEQLLDHELTHTMPQRNVDMVAAWSFTWTAPDAPGAYTLFGAGNSVNLNGEPTGDRSSTTTFAIIVVAADTPTPTPTPTALSPGGPTPTAAHGGSACAGDCDGNGSVTVSELITLVDIALGVADPTECAAGDTNHDGRISVAEIVTAVANALNGCPG